MDVEELFNRCHGAHDGRFCSGVTGARSAANGLMSAPLATFLSARRSGGGSLDWSTDGCSVPSRYSHGIGAEFKGKFAAACQRHDFGYRNFGKRGLDRTEARRAQVDHQFKRDMVDLCDGSRRCRIVATIFYAAVRSRGRGSFYP